MQGLVHKKRNQKSDIVLDIVHKERVQPWSDIILDLVHEERDQLRSGVVKDLIHKEGDQTWTDVGFHTQVER